MSDPVEQQDDLNERIVELVDQHWEEHEMPLLLSRLGGHDRGEIARLARQRANSLGAYLRQELEDRVVLIQHSERPVLIGVLPMDVKVEDDVDGWLESAQGKSAGGAPRYHPAFWAAFRKPLDQMKGRYISVSPPIRFQDTFPEERPEGFVEIAPEYIADSEMDAAAVLENAQDWLDDNELQATPFLASSPSSSPSYSHQGGGDLLERLARALDPNELKRVSLPLDIVMKLRRNG